NIVDLLRPLHGGRKPVDFLPRHVAIEDVRQAQVGVRPLAENSRHGTPDRPEADESHFTVLRGKVFRANFFGINFFCANDGAVAGGIEFRGTCHSISRASTSFRTTLRTYGLVGRSPVPASRAANLFSRLVPLSPKRHGGCVTITPLCSVRVR